MSALVRDQAPKPIEIELDVSDAPVLCSFFESDAFGRVIIGPWGSGKSVGCCAEIFRRAAEVPPCKDGIRRSRWAVIRQTYRQLRDTTIKTFLEWIRPEFGTWHAQDMMFVIRCGDVVAEVLFRALDRPDHVSKLLSLELTGAYINEVKDVSKPIWDAIPGRCGRYPRRDDVRSKANPSGAYWYGVWADTNPFDTDHYLYKLLEEQDAVVTFEVEDPATGKTQTVERRYEKFRQPGGRSEGAENLRHLPPGYYQTLTLGKDADWIHVNVDAEYGFVKDGKPMWPGYVDSVHCRADVQPNPTARILLGQDFGLTPAVVLGQLEPDGQLQIFDELVATSMGAARFGEELARKLRAEYPGSTVEGWGDPAGEARAQTDERTPYDVMDVALGRGVLTAAPTNDETLRLEAVAGRLSRLTMTGRPALVISPKAKTLRKALQGGYCLKRLEVSGGERYASKPDKNEFSHVADGLQYLCVGLGDDRRMLNGGDEPRQLRVRVHRTLGGTHTYGEAGDGGVVRVPLPRVHRNMRGR